MATCNISTLLTRACASGFKCLSPSQSIAIKLQLLCDIQGGGGVVTPVTPTNLNLDTTAVTDDTATWNNILVWQQTVAPTTNQIWRSDNGGPYALVASISGALTTWQEDANPMAPSETWDYKVRGANGATVGAFSNVITAAMGLALSGALDINITLTTLAVSYFDIDMTGCPNLVFAVFPALQICPLEQHFGQNPNLQILTLTSLRESGPGAVMDDFDAGDCKFTNLSLPNYVRCGGLFRVANNPTLANLTLNAALLFTNDGNSIDASTCALPAATINFILARCVASNLTSSFIALSGGTNAAPTGQGITDKNTLIANGCIVTTN